MAVIDGAAKNGCVKKVRTVTAYSICIQINAGSSGLRASIHSFAPGVGSLKTQAITVPLGNQQLQGVIVSGAAIVDKDDIRVSRIGAAVVDSWLCLRDASRDGIQICWV